MKGILYTRFDGGVSITYPSTEIFHIMRMGGHWRDRPRGFIKKQIELQVSSGIDPWHAERFAFAVAFGGVTEAEAWEIIRDRDCARFGFDHELVRAEDLPDRWFRDAWRRGHNSKEVYVDMNIARDIQLLKIKKAAGKKEGGLDLVTIESAIKNARDEEELRRVWPRNLEEGVT